MVGPSPSLLSPQETNPGGILALHAGPSSHIQLSRARGCTADTESPTPNDDGVLQPTCACRWSFIDGHHPTRRAPDGSWFTILPSQAEELQHNQKKRPFPKMPLPFFESHDENNWRECTLSHDYFIEDAGNQAYFLWCEITRFRIVPFPMS